MARAVSMAIVVGASGGIGRAMLEQLADDPTVDAVLAISRHRPTDWRETARQHWSSVDLCDEDTIAAAAAHAGEIGAATRIAVATGLLHAPDLAPEKTSRALAPGGLARLFQINAIGPALVAKHFLPLTPRNERSVFAALSARVGSIGDNSIGGWHGYRASKAALNMFIRTLAIEHARSRRLGICVALHPGTVDTALSLPFQSGVPSTRLFSPAKSANALLRVMDALSPEHTGGFFAWDGAEIPY